MIVRVRDQHVEHDTAPELEHVGLGGCTEHAYGREEWNAPPILAIETADEKRGRRPDLFDAQALREWPPAPPA